MNKPQRAVITGASSGIGASFARELALRGTDLVLAARRTENLNRLAEELRSKYGVKVEVVTLDLTHPEAAEILFATCTKEGQTVDMLINNAGAGPYRAFLKTTLKEHTNILQLNAVALTGLCHVFAGHMQAHGGPSWILNVASVASYQVVPKFAVYCASKSYVRIFSEIFSHELRQSNVHVGCLCPGGTATEFLVTNNQKLKSTGANFLMSSDHVAQIGIHGVLNGKSVIIPGLVNKLMCWMTKVLPNCLNLRIAEAGMDLAVDVADR